MLPAVKFNYYRDKLRALRVHLDAQILQLADAAADAADSVEMSGTSGQEKFANSLAAKTKYFILQRWI